MHDFKTYPHLRNKMLSYKNLIAAIEELEKDNIISFDEFEKLPYYEIQKQFFSIPNPTMIAKVKIMIRDKRNGKEGLSEYTIITEVHVEGKITKRVIKTQQF